MFMNTEFCNKPLPEILPAKFRFELPEFDFVDTDEGLFSKFSPLEKILLWTFLPLYITEKWLRNDVTSSINLLHSGLVSYSQYVIQLT